MLVYPPAGPWVVLAWLVVLTAQGTYSPRVFGTGPAEFRAVAIASLVTAGMIGMFCYLAQVPLSRGFVMLTFSLGTPLLLAERYVIRKWLHRLRVKGKMLHRVVAVGGPSGITEIVRRPGARALHRLPGGRGLRAGRRAVRATPGCPCRCSATPPRCGRSARVSAPTRCS